MGVVKNIGFSRFPEQSDWVGQTVNVCFDYDTANTMNGVIVRDDVEEPGTMIIRLADGRHVLASECQYRPPIGKRNA
jgi:hypothetical protein